MSQNSPIVRRMSLPLIPMGGVVAFPALPVDFELNDPLSRAALEAAKSMDSFVLLLPLIYIIPQLTPDKTMGVYLAEPVADIIAVSFTAILFAIQFRASMRKLEAKSV